MINVQAEKLGAGRYTSLTPKRLQMIAIGVLLVVCAAAGFRVCAAFKMMSFSFGWINSWLFMLAGLFASLFSDSDGSPSLLREEYD